MCHPKDQGRLEIHNLELKNVALLSKWLYHLLTIDGTWKKIIRNKYLGTKPLVQVQGQTRLPKIWNLHNKAWVSSMILGRHMIRQ